MLKYLPNINCDDITVREAYNLLRHFFGDIIPDLYNDERMFLNSIIKCDMSVKLIDSSSSSPED
jgi:hypothetical protein